MHQKLGPRAGILFGCCWFGSLALIDRSAGMGIDLLLGLIDRSAVRGLDLIVGLATLGAIDRLLTRPADGIAGLWAAIAFLAGGWPPLLVIGLVLIVVARNSPSSLVRLFLPVLATAVCWSAATIEAASAEVWAASLTLPLTRKPDWSLGPAIALFGLPWSPFALLLFSRSIRGAWPADGRAWVAGWIQVALAAGIAGTLVPGLSQPARTVALAGLLVGASSCLESVLAKSLGSRARGSFFVLFSGVLTLWLVVMMLGCFVWIVTMPYYRTLGVGMAVLTLAVAFLGWMALGLFDPRRGLLTLILLAIGLKLAHWGYFAPEWNYRRSQGSWGRAIGQWIPRKWTLYTFTEWPADLSFFIGRPVRQFRSPRYLNYLPGSESRYVLLQASEFENWPPHVPPIALVARFQDQYGRERILARTAGLLPVPGQNAPRYKPLARR
jgi:hypothetical protein